MDIHGVWTRKYPFVYFNVWIFRDGYCMDTLPRWIRFSLTLRHLITEKKRTRFINLVKEG